MGFNLSYVVAKTPLESLVDGFGIKLGDPAGEMPFNESWTATLRKTAWTVVWSEDPSFPESSEEKLAQLSNKFPIYVCYVSETVMYSAAALWTKGKPIWSLAHLGSEDIYDLTEEGELPDEYSAIKQAAIEDQQDDDEEVDYIFEVPFDLVASTTGFKYDMVLAESDVHEFRTIISF